MYLCVSFAPYSKPQSDFSVVEFPGGSRTTCVVYVRKFMIKNMADIILCDTPSLVFGVRVKDSRKVNNVVGISLSKQEYTF